MSDAQTQAAPRKGPAKLLLIALVLVLLAGGGGGFWWFSHRASGDGDEEEAAAHAPVKKKHQKPLFTTLEPFTVNLQDPRGDRFAQVGVTLQFSDPHVEEAIKDHLPAIRNEVLMLISSKVSEDLITVEGKKKLAEQIRTRAAHSMGIELPGDDEAAEPAPKKVAKAGEQADGDEAEDEPKPKKKRKKAKAAVENPIEQVLFSQFIVQ